jgi:hypothetical protein
MQFDEKKRNRADLDAFFVKNAIPSESNFSDLIASGLNQRDDGIAKPPDGPVSLQGADSRGVRRVLDLYRDFSDDIPSWTLSVQGLGRDGLAVRSGADDSPRLFVDAATGNVGVNNPNPQVSLDVTGDVQASGVLRPSAGPDGGIRFPDDAFGGTSDRAYLRWVTRGGESTTFEMRVENDGDDHIALIPSGNVGIGTDAPAYKLDVQGSIAAGNSDIYFTNTNHRHSGIGNTTGLAAIENSIDYSSLMILGRTVSGRRKVTMWDDITVNGTFTNNSDLRLKEHVTDAPFGLEEIRRLRPVQFDWRERPLESQTLGLIAQEVREVLADVVHVGSGPDELLSIEYTALIPVLINAVQELDRRLAAVTSAPAPTR